MDMTHQPVQSEHVVQLTRLPRSGLVVSRACSIAWGCKSPSQPDGGEGLAKRKGTTARRCLKEVWSKTTA